MSIEHAQTIEGWMDNDELSFLASEAEKCSLILEVGSWKGRSACALAANCPGIVICVDTWQGNLQANYASGLDREFLNSFLENTKPFKNIWPMPVDSMRAASMLAFIDVQFDMIFIDADHNYENVKAEILAFLPLLKSGGVLCGHDYTHEDWPGVKKAVDELFSEVRLINSIWTVKM